MTSFEQDPAGTPGKQRRHTRRLTHLPARLWRWLRDRRRPGLRRPSLAELLVEVPLALTLLSTAVLLTGIAGPGGF